MKIYLAGPLFNEMEISRNQRLANVLEGYGFDVYLPQRDGGISTVLIQQGYSTSDIKQFIFKTDYDGLVSSDAVICLLDGRALDEGMCVELGIAYALRKFCVGYKTDFRTQDQHGNNIMVEGALSMIVNDFEVIVDELVKLRTTRKCDLNVP